MSSRRWWIVLLTVVVACVATAPFAHAQDDRTCTEWTPWSPVHPLAVTWSWRMCPAPARRYDIQWRFSNLAADDIEFRYELFTEAVTECTAQNRGRVFASGRIKLKGGQQQARYGGRKRLRQTGFEGRRFILFLCVMPESP